MPSYDFYRSLSFFGGAASAAAKPASTMRAPELPKLSPQDAALWGLLTTPIYDDVSAFTAMRKTEEGGVRTYLLRHGDWVIPIKRETRRKQTEMTLFPAQQAQHPASAREWVDKPERLFNEDGAFLLVESKGGKVNGGTLHGPGNHEVDLPSFAAKQVVQRLEDLIGRVKNDATSGPAPSKAPQPGSNDAFDLGAAFGEKGNAPAPTRFAIGGLAKTAATAASGFEVDVLRGPPLGEAIVDVATWRNEPVLMTRDASDVYLFVGRSDAITGIQWLPLETPSDRDFPAEGARLRVQGDTLTVLGHGRQGDSEQGTFSTDLSDAVSGGGVATWTRRPADAHHEGVRYAREARVGGPIGNTIVAHVREPDGSGPQFVVVNRSQNWMTQRLDADTGGPAGGAAAAAGDFALFGPGMACDGRVRAVDSDKGKILPFPDLPRDLGMGELTVEGRFVIYSGGFDATGKPNQTVYAFDLDYGPKARWFAVGDVPALQGSARTVRVQGDLGAVAVTPRGSVLYRFKPSSAGFPELGATKPTSPRPFRDVATHQGAGPGPMDLSGGAAPIDWQSGGTFGSRPKGE